MDKTKICPDCGSRNNSLTLNYCMQCRYDFRQNKRKVVLSPEDKIKTKEELKVRRDGQLLLF